MLKNFKMSKEQLELASKQSEQTNFASFTCGEHSLKVYGLKVSDCDEPNQSWLNIELHLAQVEGVESFEIEKRENQEGKEYNILICKDSEGTELPSIKESIRVPFETHKWVRDDGSTTLFTWQNSVKIARYFNLELIDYDTLSKIAESEKSIESLLLNKVIKAKLGHRGVFVKKDNDIFKVFDSNGEPFPFANPDITNAFASQSIAEVTLRQERINFNANNRYINILSAEFEGEANPSVKAKGPFKSSEPKKRGRKKGQKNGMKVTEVVEQVESVELDAMDEDQLEKEAQRLVNEVDNDTEIEIDESSW